MYINIRQPTWRILNMSLFNCKLLYRILNMSLAYFELLKFLNQQYLM